MDGSQWRVLTECDLLEKGMATHFSIHALELHDTMKGEKDMTLKDELPRSVSAQNTTRDKWRNNFRKNEEMEPKQKHAQLWMWLMMEVVTDAVKNNIV